MFSLDVVGRMLVSSAFSKQLSQDRDLMLFSVNYLSVLYLSIQYPIQSVIQLGSVSIPYAFVGLCKPSNVYMQEDIATEKTLFANMFLSSSSERFTMVISIRLVHKKCALWPALASTACKLFLTSFLFKINLFSCSARSYNNV